MALHSAGGPHPIGGRTQEKKSRTALGSDGGPSLGVHPAGSPANCGPAGLHNKSFLNRNQSQSLSVHAHPHTHTHTHTHVLLVLFRQGTLTDAVPCRVSRDPGSLSHSWLDPGGHQIKHSLHVLASYL